MLFQGKSLSAQLLDDGIVEFKFDAQGSVNKFDQAISQLLMRLVIAVKQKGY
jgi:3-hydroxyacyl-CoA dehydrogenase/enoyl-CoA hydratase/3-hydroxybutyryl-CoA epimerase/enoyl-CoA isomerase